MKFRAKNLIELLHFYHSIDADFQVSAGHKLRVALNYADYDGAGIALSQGGRLSVVPPSCSWYSVSIMRALFYPLIFSFSLAILTCDFRSDALQRGDGKCNMDCMTAACNWDDGGGCL